MAVPFPLSSRLSQLLVAYTIEFDNEFEHLMPHQTTLHRQPGLPWLVSRAMWSNFLRFLGPEGIKLGAAEGLIRMTNLGGLERWGYVNVSRDPADSRVKPPRSDLLITPTAHALKAQQIWRNLNDVIDERWRERHGGRVFDELLDSLGSLDKPDFPTCLPVVPYANGLFTGSPASIDLTPIFSDDGLGTLLSRVLLAFTVEFESESELSLPICSDLVRVLTRSGVPIRDLPEMTGVSKEALASCVGFLERRDHVTVTSEPGRPRVKLAALTGKGVDAQQGSAALLAAIEERWKGRFGAGTVDRARDVCAAILEPSATGIIQGLTPYPDGWRAQRPYLSHTETTLQDPSARLPHHPMVLHRGGYPDGS